MKTIIGLFERPERAEEMVAVLDKAGFAAENLMLLNRTEVLWHVLGCRPGKILARDFSIGAMLEIALYTFFALAVAVSEVAAGFPSQVALVVMVLFAALGILVGGLLGVIFGYGDAEEESRLYVQGLRQGGMVVVVQAEGEQVAQTIDLLCQRNAEGVKICTHRTGLLQWLGGVRPARERATLWVRWLAWVLGVFLIFLILLLFLGEMVGGEGMPGLLAMDLCKGCLSVALLMTLLGVVVAWRWEGIGAFLIIGSMLLFEGINTIASGDWCFDPLYLIFCLTGLLFLWTWWRTNRSGSGEVAATASGARRYLPSYGAKR
jgi:hypothetical protein